MNNSKIKTLLLVHDNTGTAVAEFKAALPKRLDNDAKHDLYFSSGTYLMLTPKPPSSVGMRASD